MTFYEENISVMTAGWLQRWQTSLFTHAIPTTYGMPSEVVNVFDRSEIRCGE
jgi:hypothetical protein